MKTNPIHTFIAFGLLLAASCPAASQKVIDGPTGSNTFGQSMTMLPNGNFVVRDNGYDQPSPSVADVGMVSLYRHDGVLLSRITGSNTNDLVGSSIVLLANGNFVIISTSWNGNRGACTWGDANTGFIGGSGVVSAANSLTGSTTGDFAAFGVHPLSNGNYILRTPFWDNVSAVAANAGAVTWCDGSTGNAGSIGLPRSLVGTSTGDSVGSSPPVILTNGHIVLGSPAWRNGGLSAAGAVTWMNAFTGLSGVLSASNSLVGATANDLVGSGAVTALTNGNYVVCSPSWDNAGNSDVGAVTFAPGHTGIIGAVSTANSLVGTANSDQVGAGGAFALSNGHYVVSSHFWNDGPTADVGAATWCDGFTGLIGTVSTANSLVGSVADDGVGSSGITALTNGHYVVRSPFWNNGPTVDAGAVTWVDGFGPTSDTVSTANSLFGTSTNDLVGINLVTALPNGNYVVGSSQWNNGPATAAGAYTWGSGTTGIVGPVSTANSLIGTTAGDTVGTSAIQILPSGNYLMRSPFWDNGPAMNAGAVTWADGNKGISGAISSTTSLIGSSSNDNVGGGIGIVPLTNGNYIVRSPQWDDGATLNVGAVTWGSGTKGVRGVVSSSNSLVGTQTGDQAGNSAVVALTNGNYVVASTDWDLSATVTNAGAATWADGTKGLTGPITPANSLIGSTSNDIVGDDVIALTNGNYVVCSPNWDNGAATNAGAATWADGKKGIRGVITQANSLVGTNPSDSVGDSELALPDGNYFIGSGGFLSPLLVANASAATLCNGATGTSGLLNAGNSVFGSTTGVFLSSIYDPLRGQLIVGDPAADRVTILGNHLTTLARSTTPAPGAADITFAALGSSAVGDGGDVLFESSLTGAGASGGRNRAVFGLAPTEPLPDLLLQSGDIIGALGKGLPAAAKATSPGKPIFHAPGRGLLQATVSGPGITAANNGLILRDSGTSLFLLHRLGESIPALGGASTSKFTEVLGSHDADLVAIHYRLRSGGPAAVNANNDTGILLMGYGGSIHPMTAAREGEDSDTPPPVGKIGQITRASLNHGERVHFIGALKPTGGPAGSGVYSFQTNGGSNFLTARSGAGAPGASGHNYKTFTGVSGGHSGPLYKATLTGPTAQNEAIWLNSGIKVRKGDDVDPVNLPGVKFGKLIRFWPTTTSASQFILHCTLVGASGSGVTSANNQALIFIRNPGDHLILLRTGDSPPGLNNTTIKTISSADAHPGTGRYVALTTLSGAAGSNQALWTGDTQAGDDTTFRHLRLPTLRLRKGERYATASTPLGIIRSISIKPAPDPSGSGGRGLAQVVGPDGQATTYLRGDRNITELVVLP